MPDLITYLELNVLDSQKAADFYKKVFGWEAQAWDDSGYMVVDNGEGAGLGIDNVAKDTKPYTVAVVTVKSIDESLKNISTAGGKITAEKFPVPGQGYAAYFTTPGGLLMSVYEADENAK